MDKFVNLVAVAMSHIFNDEIDEPALEDARYVAIGFLDQIGLDQQEIDGLIDATEHSMLY